MKFISVFVRLFADCVHVYWETAESTLFSKETEKRPYSLESKLSSCQISWYGRKFMNDSTAKEIKESHYKKDNAQRQTSLNLHLFLIKTWHFVSYSTYIFKSNGWNLKQLFIYNSEEGSRT